MAAPPNELEAGGTDGATMWMAHLRDQFHFCHVEPAAVFGSVVPFEAVR